MFRLALYLVLLSQVLSAIPAIACSVDLPMRDGFAELSQNIDRLPTERSQDLANGLNRTSGGGFGVISTPPLLSPGQAEKFFAKLPATTLILFSQEPIFKAGDFLGTKTPKLNAAELAVFSKYFDWVTKQIHLALPKDEKVFLSKADLRISRVGNLNKLPHWHVDGDYLAVSISLLGPGTEYLLEQTSDFSERGLESFTNGRQTYATPIGLPLVFSCSGRYRDFSVLPTVHRSPDFRADRAFMILRYKSAR